MTDKHPKTHSFKVFWPLILLVVLITTVAGGATLNLSTFYHTPQGAPGLSVLFTVSRGQGFNVTARQIAESGLCSSEKKFRFMATFYGLDKKVKAGEYLLTGAMTPEEILNILTSGKVYLHKVTIPEGYTVRQIADVLAQAGLGRAERITELCFSKSFVSRMDLPKGAPSLEGYLYPETYFFAKTATEETILSTMVSRFKSVFTESIQKEGKELGLSPNQVVTLASIIEKETGASFERPLISSVFHNRLKLGMRLETDPTVIYGIDGFNGNLTRQDLQTRTPYNTYKIKGLPPGPIASPGYTALIAAVRPEPTPYLFFVSKRDGTHHFSQSLSEHGEAVRMYQLRNGESAE